jgi:hypothetical protein
MTMVKSTFTIDGKILLDGWHDPYVDWNGWRTPSFRLEDIMEWLKATRAKEQELGFEWPIRWSLVGDTLRVYPSEADWADEFEGHSIEGLDGQWYSVGAFSWCWTEVE